MLYITTMRLSFFGRKEDRSLKRKDNITINVRVEIQMLSAKKRKEI